jgi:hypothetical protein
MLNIRSSTATAPNPNLLAAARMGRENNLRWIERHLPEGGAGVSLLLVGGVDTVHVRLRLAQAHLRHDFSPSSWSHVALLGPRANDIAKTPLQEIALAPAGGLGFPPPDNGLQVGALGGYRDPRRYPNVAVIHLPVERAAIEDAIDRFRMQRMALDAVELLVLWLAFVWGVGRTGNPLLDGQGLPSAAMLDVVLGAAGYDITPGLESRASCPEAIWQAVRWWHGFYDTQSGDTPGGTFTAPHHLVTKAAT